MRARAGIVAAILIIGVTASAETVYKVTGPDGEVTYSDRPPAGKSRAETFEFRNLPSTALPPEVVRFREQLERSAQSRISAARAPRASEVQLFTARWCGYCTRAKTHLAASQVSYSEYDIESPDGMRAFIEAGGRGGVPLLVAGDRRIQGYSVAAYDRLTSAIRSR